MKIKNIIISVCVILSVFSFISPNGCSAETAKEKYSVCFREAESGVVSVQNMADADKEELAKLLSAKDDDLAKYLGNGVNQIEVNEMLRDSSSAKIKLTVRDSDGHIVGQIKLSSDDEVDSFWVTYWIGKDFRGHGYMAAAMDIVMQKIWSVDSSAKFYFVIDDENIASQMTLWRICTDLNANLEICDKCNSETRVSKIDESSYMMQVFEDGEEIFSYCIPEGHELLKPFAGKSFVRTKTTEYLVTR